MADGDGATMAEILLAQVREREQAATPGPWRCRPDVAEREEDAAFITAARADVPRLLAAIEAVLEHHQRVPLYGNAATDDEPGNCPHDPDSPLHFEDPGSTEWLCRGWPEGAVCSSCAEDGERATWPCPQYAAILAALAPAGPA
jgi:hypothetical protein